MGLGTGNRELATQVCFSSKWDPALVFGAFLVASWLAPLAPRATVPLQALLGAAAVVGLLFRVRRDLRGVGLRVDNLASTVAVFLLAACALSAPVVAFMTVSPISGGELATYSVWAFFQQFLVVAGFWRPFREMLGPRTSVAREATAALLASGAFALAHLPNLPLMLLVLVAEFVWLVLFARFRNLFSLSLAHALAALVASHGLAPDWLSSMRVGLRYWQP